MRVIISGGGTGGHIFPAIAIARAIQKVRPEAEILFVGAEGKMEMEKVPAAGYRIIGLPIAGIQRRLTWKNLLVPFKVFASLWKARKIIREFKPDVAVGVGGYASGPLLRVAAASGVKTLIQEQNSFPGITNKLLAPKVNKICVAYDGLEKFFPKEKILLTGNPVRSEVAMIEGKKEKAMDFFGLDHGKKTLLVIGGSLGARTINQAIDQNAEVYDQHGIQVIWQTGKVYFENAKTRAQQLKSLHAFDFIREMDLAYAAADIIVSRAGAMSISELCLVKKPAIFIPSPNVSEDHQTKNAMALVDRGAALLVKDADAASKLAETVIGLNQDAEKAATLAANIALLGKPDASSHIAQEVIKLV
jgi:UDP-N-acetylglucosamine--N-acetylmuramyl-(pentapeptide) pyrophosphoryl-undecaprenol N-acetylglucosamine transferase